MINLISIFIVTFMIVSMCVIWYRIGWTHGYDKAHEQRNVMNKLRVERETGETMCRYSPDGHMYRINHNKKEVCYGCGKTREENKL
jgi:hypothetical protein